MGHAWDIIKNIPSAVAVEVWDKVGIYQIVPLILRGKLYVTIGVPMAIWFGI